jgi:hypothetical protein
MTYSSIRGSWWTSNITVARTYGPYITKAKLILKSPFIIDAKFKHNLDYTYRGMNIDELSHYIFEKNYDSLVVHNIIDTGTVWYPKELDGLSVEDSWNSKILKNYVAGTDYIVFKANAIKHSEKVVYNELFESIISRSLII